MKLYLNAGFGEPLGAYTLALIKGLGFVGIRQGVKPDGQIVPDDPAYARVLLQEIKDAGLEGLILLGSGMRTHDAPEALGLTGRMTSELIHEIGLEATIEVVNEPDLSDRYRDGNAFRDAILSVYEQASPYGIPVVSGGVCATTPQVLDWLAAVLAQVPPDVVMGVHGYRKDGAAPNVGRGFATRAAEFARIRQVAAERRIFCTEIGWDEWGPAPPKWQFWRQRERRSPESVAADLFEEKRLQAEAGFEVMTIFQLNDDPAAGLTWGIRRVDGTLKPSAQIAREAV